MGLAQVDGRIEIGANTGGLLRYFLPNVDAAEDEAEAENRRQASYRSWLDASRGSGARAALRRVATTDEGIVVTATAAGDHCLFRLDGRGERSLEQSQKALGLPRGDDVAAQADLYRDVMGNGGADGAPI
jgi:hypothetical protein